MVLCGITHSDNELDVDYLVPKLLKTKLWDNDEGAAWKASAVELGYQILLVSQFTLYHQFKGTRPDFHDAATHEEAKTLYSMFLERLESEYLKMRSEQNIQTPEIKFVQPGSFGNYMNIEMTCDGPVTLVIESVKDAKAVKKLESKKIREARSNKDKSHPKEQQSTSSQILQQSEELEESKE